MSVNEQNYALIAAGVQRFPRPAAKSKNPSENGPKPFLFILDFPMIAEEATLRLADGDLAESSPLFLIRRLAERLGVLAQSEVVFAIKNHAGKALPNDALVSSQPAFKSDLQACDPDVLICFGARAFNALNRLLGYKIPPVEQECIDLGLATVEGRPRRVVVVPNVRELQAFPEWRAAVWQVLRSALTASN